MSVRQKPGKLNIACVSDIHFGHNKNPAERIANNFITEFPDNAETAMLDIIFLNGDIFDQLLMFNDHDIIGVDSWFHHLAHLSKKHNIELVILAGTPGHDRNQCEHFVRINKIFDIGAKLRYIKDLSIEYFADHDVHVLFVPDELPGGTDVTLRNFKDLLRARGLEQVDLAMMHGQFEFQLPPHVHAQKHNSAEYLALVKGIISIGHDHTHKQLDRIYVQGSFDRLGHGYEAPKGHIRAYQHEDETWQVRFVENTNAMVFLTVDVTGMSLEETYSLLSEKVSSLPDDAHIRVRAQYDHPIFTNMAGAIRLAPTMGWTKDPQRERKDAIAPLVDEVEAKYVPITITRDNLSELMLERIVGLGAKGRVMDAATDMLEELFPYATRSIS